MIFIFIYVDEGTNQYEIASYGDEKKQKLKVQFFIAIWGRFQGASNALVGI